MRTRPLKHLLTFTSVLLLACACVVVILGVKLPINAPDVEDRPEAIAAVKDHQADTQRIPGLSALQQLARKDLRQRLFDPPPQTKAVISAKPPPTIRLLGTIVNALNPQAMIAGPGGKTELKRIGDTVGEPGNTAVITDIQTDRIKVEHEDNTLDIPIAKDGGQRR